MLSILIGVIASGMAILDAIHRNDLDFQIHPIASLFGSSVAGVFVAGCFYWLLGLRAIGKRAEAVNDKLYETVARELEQKNVISGLWTKAFAEMEGDDARTRALYIKYRVAQLSELNEQRIRHLARRNLAKK